MNILVIHQYFLDDKDPGGSRFNEMASFWAEKGHKVTIIAGQVNYATGEKAEKFKKRLAHEEWLGNIRVIRAFTPSTFHKSITGRMWAFFGFMIASTWALFIRVKKADIVIATSPSLLTFVPGLLAKWIRNWPLIVEVRDLWPESAVSTGVLKKTSLITRFLYLIESTGYKYADKINVLTPAFKKNIISRGLADELKIVFIPNGADLRIFSPGKKNGEIIRRYGWEGKFVVLYAGAHGIANHLIQYLETAELLKDRKDIILVSIGDGPKRRELIEETKKRGLKNIQWLDPVSKKLMPDIIRSADLGAAILKRVDTFKTVYPNKIFDYMACEKPVLCVIDGVSKKLIEEDAKAGLFAEPERPEEIAKAITFIADNREAGENMGRNGRAFVEKNYARQALAEDYIIAMKEVMSYK